MVFFETAVSLEEIAKVTRQKPAEVEAEARAVGAAVGEDWAGRPAIRATEAWGLVSGAARAKADHDMRWAAHGQATKAWTADRHRTIQAAFRARYDEVTRSGRGNADAHAAASVASREAGERFERSTPPPEFDGMVTAVLMFEKKGVVKRAVERVGKALGGSADEPVSAAEGVR